MRKRGSMLFNEIASKFYGKWRKLEKIRGKLISLHDMNGTLLAYVECHVKATWHLSGI